MTRLAVSFLSLFAIATVIGYAEPSFALRMKDGEVILDKLKDYENCQGRDYTGEFCHDALERWVEAHPEDAFKAGKMTRRKMNAYAAMPFFAKAFEAGKGDCKDEDVKLAVVAAVDLPPSKGEEAIAQAKKIGIETCFTELKSALVEAAKPSSGYAFDNICKDLAAKGAISGLKLKKCNAGK